MKVLLTNDDDAGSAAGIESFGTELGKYHERRTMVPDRERNGASHPTTFRDQVVFHSLSEDPVSCNGVPVDCVFFSLLKAIDSVPRAVVSGINVRANLDTVNHPGNELRYTDRVGGAASRKLSAGLK